VGGQATCANSSTFSAQPVQDVAINGGVGPCVGALGSEFTPPVLLQLLSRPDEVCDGLLRHMHARDTSLAVISRAPLAKIEAYKARKGWTFPWYSSFGSDFNYDFHATLDESVATVEYNYRTKAEHEQAGTMYYVDGEQPIEAPGQSCFLRDGDAVFHTYSSYARGGEMTGGSYYYLDLTALGRQEDWEEPRGRAEAPRAAIPDFAT
jgi:predicted dithiol-disulfide oxidoreductase (DUF899 family)